MEKKEKGRWHEHPILAGVITAALIYAGGAMFGPFLNPVEIGKWAWGLALEIPKWLSRELWIPRWGIFLWAAITGLLAFVAFRILRANGAQQRKDRELAWVLRRHVGRGSMAMALRLQQSWASRESATILPSVRHATRTQA